MMDKINYAIFDKNESTVDSIFRDLVTFSFLIFCIYISQGSTWWTFLTGCMFLLFTLARMNSMFTDKYQQFKTKKELLEWVNKLPD